MINGTVPVLQNCICLRNCSLLQKLLFFNKEIEEHDHTAERLLKANQKLAIKRAGIMRLVKTGCLCKDRDQIVTARTKEQIPHDSSSYVHLAAFLFLLEWREVDATTLQISPH